MRFRSLVVASLFFLVGCSSEKYPFPPQFVAPTDLSEQVLPAPPSPGSKRFEEEVHYIVRQQQVLSPAKRNIIVEENHIAPEMIVFPVLGKTYTRASHPELYTLLAHAGSDAWRLADVNQDYWKSPRPWYADDRVELIAPKITSYGYPSGHTTTNHVWAHVLSDLFPTKRKALFARADEIATHRMQGGVHFPHDLEGGRTLARAIYTKMHRTAEYQHELETARQELRSPRTVH